MDLIQRPIRPDDPPPAQGTVGTLTGVQPGDRVNAELASRLDPAHVGQDLRPASDLDRRRQLRELRHHHLA
jgi:hypothetical protein